MASTPEGRRLTEAHRQAQQRVRAEFLAQYVALWELLDSRRLDETSPGWVAAVLRLIVPFREQSARVSASYFTEFRSVEVPSPPRRIEVPSRGDRVPASALPTGATPGPPRSRPGPSPSRTDAAPRPRRQTRVRVDEDALRAAQQQSDRRTRVTMPDIDWAPADRAARVSVTVTGPVSQKSKAARGKPLQVARDESFVESAGAASRHVLTGGRQSLLQLVQQDQQAVGWIRVTDGDPCAFCALLASRGVVYSNRVFDASNSKFDGPGTVKVHDNCACTLEPVYSRSAPWPGRAAEFRRLYAEVVGFAPANKFSGQAAINAFRRAYEAQQRDARRTAA